VDNSEPRQLLHSGRGYWISGLHPPSMRASWDTPSADRQTDRMIHTPSAASMKTTTPSDSRYAAVTSSEKLTCPVNSHIIIIYSVIPNGPSSHISQTGWFIGSDSTVMNTDNHWSTLQHLASTRKSHLWSTKPCDLWHPKWLWTFFDLIRTIHKSISCKPQHDVHTSWWQK